MGDWTFIVEQCVSKLSGKVLVSVMVSAERIDQFRFRFLYRTYTKIVVSVLALPHFILIGVDAWVTGHLS